MMQALRDKMKHIMMFVLLSFLATIVFSWGMGGFKRNGPLEKGIVGKINGREIQYQNYMNAVNQQLQALRQQRGDAEITEYQQRSVRDQVWNQMVQDVLYKDEIARLNITVSPEEVVYQLRNNPPAFLTSNEQFQTNGTFDIVKYHEALNNPQNYDSWRPIENYLMSVIPLQKLRQRIIGAVTVSRLEVREAYRLENEKVKASILFYNPNELSGDTISVSDAEVKAYYNSHRDEYQDVEKRKIDYVLLSRTPSASDTAQVYDDAQYILDELKDGTSFEELAQTYSDDAGTAEKGGDLGFFGKGEMVKPFSDAVFNARPGDIVGPVRTQYGLHIIEVLAKKREDGEIKMHARHILLKFDVSNETLDNLYEKAQYIHDEAEDADADFNELCAQENLVVLTSAFFSKQSFIPGIGMSDKLAYLTFSEKVGFVGGPVSAGNSIVVFQIKKIQKAGTKPFEEVQAGIRQNLIKAAKNRVAAALCQSAYDRIQAGATLAETAAHDSLALINTDYFTLQAYVPKIGRDAKMNGAAFGLKVNEISKPVISDKGAYLIQITDRREISDAAFEDAYEDTYKDLLDKKQEEAFTAWYNNLMAKADIKDYREMYF